MIVIIDYKMGNVGSILNMIKKIGFNAKVSLSVEEIRKAEKLILPGVGAFDAGMQNLAESGLMSVVNEKVFQEKTPVLGICLGMQLFARRSEEGVLDGLNWVDGEVKKFQFQDRNLRIPHMGWNTISVRKDDVIFNEMPAESRFYFVHSYRFACDNKDNVLATTNYGYDFDSIIRKDNIWGVQFHPEKSHKFGMQLLKNFVSLC